MWTLEIWPYFPKYRWLVRIDSDAVEEGRFIMYTRERWMILASSKRFLVVISGGRNWRKGEVGAEVVRDL